MLRTLFLASFLLSVAPVRAETPLRIVGVDQRPAELLNGERLSTYALRLGEAAGTTAATILENCPSVEARSVGFAPYAALVDPADRLLNEIGRDGGLLFRERIEASGCERRILFNYVVGFFDRDRGQAARIIPALPGETRVSFGVFMAANSAFLASVAHNAPRCEGKPPNFAYLDTRVTVGTADSADWTVRWREKWTAQRCGTTFTIPFEFRPTPAGGYAILSNAPGIAVQ